MQNRGMMDRRYLKAGRFLVIDLKDGSASIVQRHTGTEQRERRARFVKKNWKLCEKAFELGHGIRFSKSEHARKLVDKARKKLGYSQKTNNGDVYMCLFCSFIEMHAKPLNGCDCGWCKRFRFKR